jgi:hypothetical protein
MKLARTKPAYTKTHTLGTATQSLTAACCTYALLERPSDSRTCHTYRAGFWLVARSTNRLQALTTSHHNMPGTGILQAPNPTDPSNTHNTSGCTAADTSSWATLLP